MDTEKILKDLNEVELSNAMTLVTNLFEDLSDKIKPVNKEFLEWLEYSKKDLSSSKILFEKQDYRNSIYLLQQSVEKLCKYYGLSKGLIEETDKDLKNVGHISPKIFQMFVTADSVNLVNSIGELNIQKDDFINILNRNKDELSNFNENVIDVYLSLPKKMEDGFNQIGLDFGNLIEVAIFNMKLYLIAVLTYSHEVFTRYPTDKIKYDQNTPIVKKYLEIVKVVEEVIGGFEK